MRPIRTLCLALTLPASGLNAADKPSLAPTRLLPPEARNFSLGNPNLHRVERSSGNLVAADLNGDGRLDFATVNNAQSRVEVFLQDPRAEERFRREIVALSQSVQSMRTLDVNGDGRTDLLMTSANLPVSVMYQSEGGSFQARVTTSLEADSAVVGDLNGDDSPEVILYQKGRFQILKGKARGIELTPGETFFSTSDPSAAPMILDLDGDGRKDLCWQDSNARDTFVVRLQSAEGTFPAEFRVNTGQVISAAAATSTSGADLVAAVMGGTRRLALMRLGAAPRRVEGQTVTLSNPYTTGFDRATRPERVVATVADVDGDGRRDIVVATPNLPSLRVLRQTRSGYLEAKTVPSFQGVDVVWPLKAKSGEPAPLLIGSSRERAIGIAQATGEDNHLSLPELLPQMGAPRAVAPVRDAEGNQALIVLSADAKGFLSLQRHAGPKAEGKPALAEGTDVPGLKLDDVKAMNAFDMNGDGRDDLAFFRDFKPTVVLVQDAKGSFSPVRARGGALEGLLSETKLLELVPIKLDGQRESAVLSIKGQFARAFRLGADGTPRVLEQFNGRTSRSRFVTGGSGKFRSNNRTDIALYDGAEKAVLLFGRREAERPMELLHTVPVDGDFQDMAIFDLDGDGRDDIALVAPDRVTVLYASPRTGGFETIASAETGVHRGGYQSVWSGQVIPGGPSELIAMEGRENLLEFFTLGRNEEGDLDMLRFFQFRQYDQVGQERDEREVATEPRSVIAEVFAPKAMPTVLALTHEYVIRYEATQRVVPREKSEELSGVATPPAPTRERAAEAKAGARK